MSEARIVNAVPLTYRKYVDNSHARFQTEKQKEPYS